MRLPGPGAFGGRSFLTTLPSSVMLNSLTTRGGGRFGGGGLQIWEGREVEVLPLRGMPLGHL